MMCVWREIGDDVFLTFRDSTHEKCAFNIPPLFTQSGGASVQRERDGAGVRQLPPGSGVGWREEARGVQAPG